MSRTRALYELAEGYNSIFDLALDDTMDLQALEEGLQAIEGELSDKVANGIGLIQSLKAMTEAMKAEEKRISNRRKVIEKKTENVKDWYQRNLEAMGKTKVETPRGTMSVQKNPPSLVIDDETKIPDAYFDIIPEHAELNKEKLKAALKGEEIPGAHLEQGKGLRIR